MPEIIPSIYKKKDKNGDFAWMIKQEIYNDSLFIFNDNIEHKCNFNKGKGNACIRPYNKYNPYIDIPQSAGIPTGSLKNGGFQSLTVENKKYIDEALDKIVELIKKYKYKQIIYSAESKIFKLIGNSLFIVGNDVREYITQEIYKLKDL